MQAQKTILFNDKKDCCACGACVSACSKKAIEMRKDAKGFLYPVVNESKCVHCGICHRVCGYQNEKKLKSVDSVYAAVADDYDTCMKSASGGLFSILARVVIKDEGVVFGAAMLKVKETLVVRHIAAHNEQDLVQLQGSKYVQSSIGDAYQQAELYLKQGKKVLFSGTPCQIAGLQGFLRRDYENLVTIDIICHGVPSEQFFQDYLKSLINGKNAEIQSFKFRDKTKGWGLTAKYTYTTVSGKTKVGLIPFRASSYYDMFINCETYRENCYSCPFACADRIGDITLGDFWGIQRQHPEWMKSAGGVYSEDVGISCVLVNTDKGVQMIEQIKDAVQLRKSEINKVAKENHQLSEPSNLPKTRDMILKLYEESGYESVDAFFRKRTGMKIFYYYLKNAAPKSVKKIVKAVLKKS